MKLWRRWRSRRDQRHDATVLGCLLLGDIYGYDMMRRTGLGSGAIWPALARLERDRLIWSEWVEWPTGTRRRRRYELTRRAAEMARRSR